MVCGGRGEDDLQEEEDGQHDLSDIAAEDRRRSLMGLSVQILGNLQALTERRNLRNISLEKN